MNSNNLKRFVVAFTSIILFFSVALLTINFWWSREGIANATSTNISIYEDSLESNFVNWSWNSAVNTNAQSPVYKGSRSIQFTPQAWGALYLHSNTAVDLTQYTALSFRLYPTGSIKSLQLLFYDHNNQVASLTLPLEKYIQNPSTNSWNHYSIPTQDIAPYYSRINGFAIQNGSSSVLSQMYLDSIELVGKQVAEQPTQVVSKQQEYIVYDDALKADWHNWSWDSAIALDSSEMVFSGHKSIRYEVRSAWGGLFLHTDQGVPTNSYPTLQFALRATRPGQEYALLLYGPNSKLLRNPIPLHTYGLPPANTWKEYTINLSDYGLENNTLTGIGINDFTGNRQPALFIDSIKLVGAAGIPVSSPTTDLTPTQTSTLVQPTPSPATNKVSNPNNSNPLSGMPFFNNAETNPAQGQADQWRSSRPQDSETILKIAHAPKGMWMGGWSGDIRSTVQSTVDRASSIGAMPVFIAYNIPHRDCGSYSAGGTASAESYRRWIDGFSAGIGSRAATVILEPDALAGYECLPESGRNERMALIKYAVEKFKSLGSTRIYIDAGHAKWIEPVEMSKRLQLAGISSADGFAVNVSNFQTTADSISYGKTISSQTGGKHFVIDTSRNGNGPAGNSEWCNPQGRALGIRPTTQTGEPLVDAFLWLKYPGESDGGCNGAPSAGAWYPEYALGLAQRASW